MTEDTVKQVQALDAERQQLRDLALLINKGHYSILNEQITDELPTHVMQNAMDKAKLGVLSALNERIETINRAIAQL